MDYKFTDEEKAQAEKEWKSKNDKIRHISRYRPEGQCFQCGQIKKELMEDPNNPSKIYNEMYIYCNECYEEQQANYKKKGRWP